MNFKCAIRSAHHSSFKFFFLTQTIRYSIVLYSIIGTRYSRIDRKKGIDEKTETDEKCPKNKRARGISIEKSLTTRLPCSTNRRRKRKNCLSVDFDQNLPKDAERETHKRYKTIRAETCTTNIYVYVIYIYGLLCSFILHFLRINVFEILNDTKYKL